VSVGQWHFRNPLGRQFTFADGSVQFVPDRMDTPIGGSALAPTATSEAIVREPRPLIVGLTGRGRSGVRLRVRAR